MVWHLKMAFLKIEADGHSYKSRLFKKRLLLLFNSHLFKFFLHYYTFLFISKYIFKIPYVIRLIEYNCTDLFTP